MPNDRDGLPSNGLNSDASESEVSGTRYRTEREDLEQLEREEDLKRRALAAPDRFEQL